MKKYKILFLLCLLPLFAQADPVLIDGIYYNLKGTEAEVTNSEGGQGDLFFSAALIQGLSASRKASMMILEPITK